MVTDAAGTGFEIKKPHKGTETISNALHTSIKQNNLKLRNPIRGRKLLQINYYNYNFLVFEIKKPHKGTETRLLQYHC